MNLHCTFDLWDADYVGIHSPTPSSTHCWAQKSGNRSINMLSGTPPLLPPLARQLYWAFLWEMRDWSSQSWPFFITNPHFPSLFLLLTFLGKYRQYLLKTYFFGSVLLWYLFWQKQTWSQNSVNSNWDNVSRNFTPNSCLHLSFFPAISEHSGYCWFLKLTSSK